MAKMNAGMMAIMAKKKGATKMAGGGMPMKDGKPAFIGDGKGMKHGGMTKAKKMNMGGMANGGSASKRADGVVSKGKTKGSMVKMNMGGMANGGSASSRADGVASKGKTKGTMIGMKNGGKAC